MTSSPTNAPDGWASVLSGPEETVQVLAGRIRAEGFRVVTRHDLDAWRVYNLGGGRPTELLVPALAVPRVAELLRDWGVASRWGPDRDCGQPGTWEPEVVDPSEGSLESLSGLCDAACRLRDQPWNARVGADLAAATEAIQTSTTPYGFDSRLWSTAARLGAQLRAMIEEKGSVDAISHAAGELQALLRDHV